MATKPIIFGNFSAGIGISKYSADRFDDMNNVDLMSEIGTARCNLALANTTNPLTEPVTLCLTPGGKLFLFSKTSGKIWKRDTDGTFSTPTTNPNGAHYSARYYDTWVYYTTKTKIGRMTSDTGTRDDSWHGLPIGDNWHPMAIINKRLFIGDGQNLCMADENGNWSNGMVTLERKMNIIQLLDYGYDLLIFTNVDSSLLDGGAFRYDTVSVAWGSEDYIDESGVNYALKSNNTDRVYCVTAKGGIYEHNGVRMEKINSLRGIQPGVGNGLKTIYNGKPLFAIGGTIYGLINPVPGGPVALTKEYVCSQGSGATITGIAATFSQLFVAWQNGSSYGLDTLSPNYATATLDTPISLSGQIRDVQVAFDSLPTGCSIGIQLNCDNSGWSAPKEVIPDKIDKHIVRLKGIVGNNRTLQARITLTPNNTGTPSTPIVQYIQFIPS